MGGMLPWRWTVALSLAAMPGVDDGVSAPPHPPGGARDAAQVDLARALLARHQCGACHRIPGVPGAAGQVGPALDRFGQRSYIAGRVPNDEARLVRWIVAPSSLVPATPMPALGVAEADARVMAVYLLALR